MAKIVRTLTKWEFFVWRIKNWKRFANFEIPLTRGRTLHVHLHHWTGFKPCWDKGECSCLGMWVMWFFTSIDYGTCNFAELEKRWFGLDDDGNKADK